MLFQELNQQDFGRRTTYAETMLQMFEEDPKLVILTSDEGHFHLNVCEQTKLLLLVDDQPSTGAQTSATL